MLLRSALFIVILAARSTSAGDRIEPLANRIYNPQPPFYVAAEVNHANREYHDGETLAVRVKSEKDAYLYVWYQQADGKSFQIFPNRFQPDNRVAANQAVEIPASDDLFRWVVGTPYGKEVVKVIASLEPLEQLSSERFMMDRFTPLTAADVKGIEVELDEEEPSQWAETDIEITTLPPAATPSPSEARRWGVFFGVSVNEFSELMRSAGKDPHDLPAPAKDAPQVAQLMKSMGGLSEARVYVNEQATRSNMEQAITGWLASVSKPGDTVFIYYTGHTGQIVDDNGDEPDGRDEVMITYDCMLAPAFQLLYEQYQNGQLDDGMARRVEQYIEIARSGGEQWPDELWRHTGVTDDAMGRWLQRLSGRQVVLISDSCHSGGFATHEDEISKSLRNRFSSDYSLSPRRRVDAGSGQGPRRFALQRPAADPRMPPADVVHFLDDELVRMKDLGQREQALLAAARFHEPAWGFPEHAAMTFALLDVVQKAPSLTLEQCYASVKQGMAELFEQVNQQRRARGLEPIASIPVMFNYCSQPVIVKPAR